MYFINKSARLSSRGSLIGSILACGYDVIFFQENPSGYLSILTYWYDKLISSNTEINKTRVLCVYIQKLLNLSVCALL